MKNIALFLFSLSIPFLFNACSGEPRTASLITIDVTKKYPQKQIRLSDIARVEYVQLETTDESVVTRQPSLVTDDYIIYGSNSGEMTVFDCNGRYLHRFNHRGEGPEEYLYLIDMAYDKAKDELFISTTKRIQVYSLKGHYKRSLPLTNPSGTTQIFLFREDDLLCCDYSGTQSNTMSVISRRDGSFVQEIEIPLFEKRVTTRFDVAERPGLIFFAPHIFVTSHNDGYLLSETSSDTIYQLDTSMQIHPVIAKTPSAEQMEFPLFLNGMIETKPYTFTSTTLKKATLDREIFFPTVALAIDRNNGEVYEAQVVNDDYPTRDITIDSNVIEKSDQARVGYVVLETSELFEANEAGELNGPLKEIVDQLSEDDNDVLMLLHFNSPTS